MARRTTTTYGFARAAKLVESRIREAGETRGFAVTKLLTHWEEVAGDMAQMARPVDVKYGRQGFGATLTVLTTGPHAPLVEMQKERLREKVNQVYGYNAISRINVTQTARTGFADGQVDFTTRKPEAAPKPVPPAIAHKARDTARDVSDEGLRSALERLAQNVLSRQEK
jgi:hypothetical protein